MIDWLCDQVRSRDIAVAGLYCDYLAHEQQSATNVLGAILKQLLERDGIPESLRDGFRAGKRGFGGRAVQLPDLVKILKTTIASLPEVFICVDGLDECLQKNRQELLESLRDIARASPAARVFLSGRPHIRDEVKKYFAGATTIAVIPKTGDIKKYLEMRLDRDPIPSAMDDNLRVEIMRVILRKISQMRVGIVDLCLVGYPLIIEYRFLLISLNIEAVLEEVTIYQRRRKLDEMIQGNGLRSAYSTTLQRIQAQKGSRSKLGMEVLMWLSHSERPLKANELCHALGVEIGSTDLNSQNIPTIETLLGCSLGLVIVEASSFSVRLVHYTLQEYLCNNSDLFHSPHAMIAEVCLTYLNFQCVMDLPPTFDWYKSPITLLEYASCYWGTHARREITGSVNKLALRLLDRFDRHVSSGIFLSRSRSNWDWGLARSDPAGFTGLHCTAHLGIVGVAVALLGMKKWDLGATDVSGYTAILWAVIKGHGAMVKMLLEREDVAPNIADKDGRTPLLWAIINRHKDIVRMLLEREYVTPNITDNDGRTPLMLAVETGYKDVVKSLLEREDVTPNTKDKDGQTPLLRAAKEGLGDIVKLLLGREDVTPNTTDKGLRTPLLWAARNGHGAVVKLLLEREDVSPNTTDKGGRTPVLWAAYYGHERIVKMLLGREDTTPDTADKYGRTPLSWAAGNWHAHIVQMLLAREGVTPDTADKYGRTPLFWAAGSGHAHIMKMLLAREDVTPNTADKEGRTPLLWASENGDEEIVKILLERKDVTPNTADKDGRTPLLWAVGKSYERIVVMLLEREDIILDSVDKDGRTALSWAVERRHTRIVEILLPRCRFNQDIVMKDLTSQIALTHTSEEQHVRALKRRLENQGSVPHSADSNSLINLFPDEPSEPSQSPSKRIRRS